MLESFKRLTKHSAVYGVGHIVSRSIGFLLLPLYTNYLLPQEYGVAALLFTYLAIMNVFFTYGLDAAFLRFFILAKDKVERREVFSTAFASIFVTALLFFLLIFVFCREISEIVFRSSDHYTLIKLASGILFFDALAVLPFLILRAEERSVKFTIFKFINIVVNLFLNVLFIVYLDKGVEGIFISNLIASAFTLTILLPIIISQFSFSFSKGIESELLRFGIPYIPSGLAVIVMDLIDRFLLDRIVGREVTGIYSAGYKLGMFMALFVAAFRFAWHPFFLSTSKEAYAKEIFSRVLTYFVLAASGVFLVISLFIEEIVHFKIFGFTIFGKEYWGGTVIVPVIMASYILYGVYVNFVVGIHLEKKTKYLPYITGTGALVNIFFNLLLIPPLGMMGAAYATLIAYASMTLVLYFVAQHYYPIKYEFSRVAKIAFSAGLIFFLGKISVGNFYFIFKLVLLIIYPFLLWGTGFFDRLEIQRVKSALKKA